MGQVQFNYDRRTVRSRRQTRKARDLAGLEGRGGGFGAAAYALVIAFFVVTLLAILSGLGDTIGRTLQDFLDSLPLPT